MAASLEGKVAVVTGAARGQGRSHAERLAAEGADVIAIDNCAEMPSAPYAGATRADLDQTVAAVEETGRRAFPAVVDVRDGERIAATIREGVAALGGRLDIVVANAGIVSYHPADELPRDTWTETIDTNLTGVWNLVQPCLRPMIDGGEGGSIILTSSTAALTGLPHLAHYSAAKAGLIGLMQSLAVELGPHRIRVNTIHPTAVNSGMTDNDAMRAIIEYARQGGKTAIAGMENALPFDMLEASDIANAVAWLVSDEAWYVTGVNLPLDGGFALAPDRDVTYREPVYPRRED
jgi:SDR family mycofactocin-dependent oxidoreductase